MQERQAIIQTGFDNPRFLIRMPESEPEEHVTEWMMEIQKRMRFAEDAILLPKGWTIELLSYGAW